MRLLFFILIPLFAGTFIACRATKKIQQAITKKDTVVLAKPDITASHADTLQMINNVIDSIENRHVNYTTFSARTKVVYANKDGKQPDFIAFIRMKKDSVIWISLANDIGIEGIRILITPDSIKVMDKIAKTIQIRPLSLLQELSQIPFSYTDLQHIILGRAIFFNKDSVYAYANQPEEYLLSGRNGVFNHTLSANSNYCIAKNRIDDASPVLGRRADLFYKEYEWKEGIAFSTLREIFISYKNVFNVQMKFKEYHFDALLSYPFNVPKKFKKIP
jgi:hypothetical protein